MKKSTSVIISAIVFALSLILLVVYIFIVKNVDVATVSYSNGVTAKIGLSSINLPIVDAVGTPNQRFSGIANGLVVLSLVPIAAVAFIGLYQIIIEHHLLKADPLMYATLITGILLLVLYFVFDKIIVINYRPSLVSGALKASFPSSHTLFAIFSLSISWYFFHRYIKYNWLNILLIVAGVALVALIGVSKILCAEHYLSDIIGSVVFGVFLFCGTVFFEKLFIYIFDKTIYEGEGHFDPKPVYIPEDDDED